jgi:glyoxylase-like metal-dependent hydrolase (beta-lactamase superfamily II)
MMAVTSLPRHAYLVADPDGLTLVDTSLPAIAVPGHTPGSTAFHLPRSRVAEPITQDAAFLRAAAGRLGQG